METLGTLPEDILIDILARLPAKPLMRFKSVSRWWYDLISDPDFAKEQLNRSLATQPNFHFIFRQPIIHMGDFDSSDNDVELNYPFKSPIHGGAGIIGCCNGLLCLKNFDYFNFIVFLFNPTTRTYTMLPLLPRPPHVAHHKHEFIHGFGYDSVTDDYKFVRILQCLTQDKSEFCSELMVYSLNLDSWFRVLDHVPFFNCRRARGVLVEEKLHWVIATELREFPHPIVSFSLNSHCFSEVALPEVDINSFYVDMYVGELDGCLCVLANYLYFSEIFVMKQYGVVESWSKLCRVRRTETIRNLESTIAFINDRKTLLVRHCHTLLASINLETLKIENLSMDCPPAKRYDAHVCVENLLMLDYFSDLPESEEQGFEDEDDQVTRESTSDGAS